MILNYLCRKFRTLNELKENISLAESQTCGRGQHAEQNPEVCQIPVLPKEKWCTGSWGTEIKSKNGTQVAGVLQLNRKCFPIIAKGTKPQHSNHTAMHSQGIMVMKCTDKKLISKR